MLFGLYNQSLAMLKGTPLPDDKVENKILGVMKEMRQDHPIAINIKVLAWSFRIQLGKFVARHVDAAKNLSCLDRSIQAFPQ